MNVSKNNLQYIAEENSFKIAEASPLAGGDINDIFLITTTSAEKFVIKLNDPHKFPGMFRAENAGLQALSKPDIFTVPQVIKTGEIMEVSYIILEYIAPGKPAKDFWESFGAKLAALHKNTFEQFGFEEDNYIGSLPQQNNWCKTASEFYITQRLEPQFKIAKNKGFELGDTSVFLKSCEQLIPEEPPSLIHGDLWSSNYLHDSQGFPCLIDPAVAYASREMDLAMMKLFGGFAPVLFDTYNEVFPLKEDHAERISLWQLYYLLVHLNIFGAGYKSQVVNIIKCYS